MLQDKREVNIENQQTKYLQTTETVLTKRQRIT